MPDNTIRISCAALCRIEIGDEFLLEINKNRGNVLTPIGGAFEFREDARPFLESLGAEFQKGSDLRLRIPTEKIPDFREWFLKKEGRETDPLRELREELIDEHRVLSAWPDEEPVLSFLKLVELQEIATGKGQEGVLTQYFYEIFSVRLPHTVECACVDASSRINATLHLLSREERTSLTPQGHFPLAETSRIVIQS